MFESFYGLSANPFRLSADEQFRYAHKSYVKAWSYLKYALEQAEGFVLITGRPGTGKTTLVRDILAEQDESELKVVNLITNQFQGEELLRTVALEIGFQANDFNKATLLTRISDYATQQHDAGRRVIILVDEAQNLTENGLEELRLLSNLQIGSQPLFQIFLIGQEEVRNLIYGRGLVNIQQRILAACRLEPMDARYVEGYIEHRLGIVGWDHDPELDPELFPLIHMLSQGVPREVNQLMSRLLLYGALEEKHRLTDEDLWVVVQELDREHRLGIDVQAVWAAYQREKPQLSDVKVPDGEDVSMARHEAMEEAPEPQVSADASSNPAAVELAEAEAEADESALYESDEESTEVEFTEPPPVLHDVYTDRTESSQSKAPELGKLEVDDALSDLPSMRAYDVFETQHHSHLLTDIDDLLDDEHGNPRSWRKRWRWFFYPLLIILLLLSLLVPKPGDLPEIGRVIWRSMLGQKVTEVDRPDELQESESTLQSSAQKTEVSEIPIAVSTPATTEPVQEEAASPPDSEEQAKDLPPYLEAKPSLEPRQAASRDIRIEMEKNYLVYLDENGSGPVQDSLGLVRSALDAVIRDQQLLIVITGLTRGSDNPIVQMRQALRQAESLTDYLVAHGASRAQISMEGSAQEYAFADQTGRISVPNNEDSPVVRLKLTRLKAE